MEGNNHNYNNFNNQQSIPGFDATQFDPQLLAAAAQLVQSLTLGGQMPQMPSSGFPGSQTQINGQQIGDKNKQQQLNEEIKVDYVGVMSLTGKKNVVKDIQSKKTWEELNVPQWLINNLCDTNFNYQKPSIIQAFAIPKILENPQENFIFQSGNGSGKTGAFVIPALMKIDQSIDAYQVVIIENTRELNRQVYQFIEGLIKGSDIKVFLGIEQNQKVQPAHIFIGSLGSIRNKLEGRGGPSLDLSQCKVVIFDEADAALLNQSCQTDISTIHQHFQKIKVNPQYVLFSATVDEETENIANQFINPTPTVYGTSKQALKNIKQLKIKFPEGKEGEMGKRKFVEDFLTQHPGQAMLFVNTINTANFLKELIQKISVQKSVSMSAQIITGRMSDKQRDTTIDHFRSCNFNVLICTDVLARGIDIPEVDIVINYDLPVKSNQTGWKEPDNATYQHRVGRTGRFMTDGISVTLYQGDSEESMVKKIEEYWDNQMQEITNFNQFLEMFFEMRPYLKTSNVENL